MKSKVTVFSVLIGLLFLVSLFTAAEAPPYTVVYLNFEGDSNFPSVTSLLDTTGLAPFTGSAFRLTQDERNELVQEIIELVSWDFRDFNVRFVTDPSMLAGDYYTWGIDDTAYVFAVYDEEDNSFDTFRLFGKAGGNPNTDPGDHPRHARTWARSLALYPWSGFDLPEVSIWDILENVDIETLTVQLPPLEISDPPFEIPFEPFNIPWDWIIFPPIFGMPVYWSTSNPPLILLHHCTGDETRCDTGWGGCGRYDCGPYISLSDIAQALANNAAHEISHMFGTLHDGEINPATGNPVSVVSMADLLMTEDEWIEGNTNKSFGPDNYQILMNTLGPTVPDNPELTSPTHGKGQPSCEQVLIVEWETPWASRGVGGYSYTIVSQDDPYYDIYRTPDDTIDLDPSATSFTTEPLEPGQTWEFNIRTIDSEGTASMFYASFWVQIESCAVEVTYPRAVDVFQVGDWPLVCWESVYWEGDDVSAGYEVETIDLYRGLELVTNLWGHSTNICRSWLVPDVEPGSDYRIGVLLVVEPWALDLIPELPQNLLGFSDYFTIIEGPVEIFTISGGAYYYPEGGRYRASFSMDITTGDPSSSGWLRYYYTRTRMNFVSTGITEASVSGNTATISGTGSVNGVEGYTFTATVIDGDPDSFGITILNSDGSTYYSAGPGDVSGGDLTISIL